MKCAVFAGPTLSADEIRAILPDADVLPPIARGDLYALATSATKVPLVVVIDGLFGVNFAATAGEFADACGAGVKVVGASSLGAVRAVECRPFGMAGEGLIYEAFLGGRLESDAEVAVGVDPTNAYRATTVALVDVRAAMDKSVKTGLLSSESAEASMTVLAGVHYLERSVDLVRHVLGEVGGLSPQEFTSWRRSADIKRRDALGCLQKVSAHTIQWPVPSMFAPRERVSERGFPSPVSGALVSLEDQRSFVGWLVRRGRTEIRPTGWDSDSLSVVFDSLEDEHVLDAECLAWLADSGLAGGTRCRGEVP